MGSWLQQGGEVGFAEHRHPEALGFGQFAAGGFARHQVVGLLADAAAHFAARRFDQRFGCG